MPLDVFSDSSILKAIWRMGVHKSAITRSLQKLKALAPKVATQEKAKAFAEPQFNVMEDCLRDLPKLQEILDPVLQYNLGDRAAFIALKRKIESRVVEEAPEEMGRRCSFGVLLVNYGFQVTSLPILSNALESVSKDHLPCLAVKDVGVLDKQVEELVGR